MTHDARVFVVSAVLAFGVGAFLLCLLWAAFLHVVWSRDRRRRGRGYVR